MDAQKFRQAERRTETQMETGEDSARYTDGQRQVCKCIYRNVDGYTQACSEINNKTLPGCLRC